MGCLLLFCSSLTSLRHERFALTAPPSPVHPFGYAPPLPLGQRISFHPRSSPSSPRARSLRRRAARDRPEQPSRILLSVENRPCTRCRDKFRCDLFGGQSLLPH